VILGKRSNPKRIEGSRNLSANACSRQLTSGRVPPILSLSVLNWDDTSRGEADLNYKLKIDFGNVLCRTVEWYQGK
jgi:hypothetical protein